MTSANGVAMSRASMRCVHNTRSLAYGYATRTSLAASVRPCCRRRSASRLFWRPLHAAEHLSSPETGHARCCRGPRSVDRVPGGVAPKGKEAARTRDRQAAAASQDEAEESDATEEEATRERTTTVSGTVPMLLKSTMYYRKAPLAISRGGRSEALGRSLCVIRVGIHQW